MELLVIIVVVILGLVGVGVFAHMYSEEQQRKFEARQKRAFLAYQEQQRRIFEAQSVTVRQPPVREEPLPPQPILPYPRHIEDFRDYEFRSAEVMKAFGFGSVRVTQGSRDGGLDVICNQAVAQCKMHMRPIGTPALQQFYGAASAYVARLPLYFAASGYSAGALTWGTEKRMYLFTLKTNGEIKAENQYARNLMSKGWARMELERKANG